jgi:hypothetical protein
MTKTRSNNSLNNIKWSILIKPKNSTKVDNHKKTMRKIVIFIPLLGVIYFYRIHLGQKVDVRFLSVKGRKVAVWRPRRFFA